MADFTFNYRLDGAGWSSADVSCGDQTAVLVGSYISEPLDDLIVGLIRLVEGATLVDVFWALEPGEMRWRFDADGDRVAMTIAATDDDFAHAAEHGTPRVPFFVATAPTREVATQIARGAAAVLLGEGELGYLEKWGSGRFPTELLHRLERNVGITPTTPPVPSHRTADEGRDVLELQWEALLDGRSTATQADGWLRSLSWSADISPVQSVGRSIFREQVDRQLQNRFATREPYDLWLESVALYDADPLEWHRVEAVTKVRRSLHKASFEEAMAIARWAFTLLEGRDVEKLFAEYGVDLPDGWQRLDA